MKEKTKKETAVVRRNGNIKVAYLPETHPHILRCMLSAGCTLAKIASEIGITLKVLNYWIETYPEMKYAKELGIKSDIGLVESMFLSLCLPRIITEEEIHYDSEGNVLKKVVKKKEREPNAQACWRYLVTKSREDWYIGKEGQINVSDGIKIVISKEDEGL